MTDQTVTACTETGNCLEVRFAGNYVFLRNNRHPANPSVMITGAEWAAFLDQVKAGRFDADQHSRPSGGPA